MDLKIRGTILGGPSNTACGIWGSQLGSPHFGKLAYRVQSLSLGDLAWNFIGGSVRSGPALFPVH